MSTLRAAVVQLRPAHLDLAASIARVVERTREAAAAGAQVVAFGESVLPGYPAWLDHAPEVAKWDHGPTKAVP